MLFKYRHSYCGKNYRCSPVKFSIWINAVIPSWTRYEKQLSWFKSISCFELIQIEFFHMTSRRPYWCPKTMKWWPCWCPKPILWELNSFLIQTLSFVSINLHRCWPREWKHSFELNWCARWFMGYAIKISFPRPPQWRHRSLGYYWGGGCTRALPLVWSFHYS